MTEEQQYKEIIKEFFYTMMEWYSSYNSEHGYCDILDHFQVLMKNKFSRELEKECWLYFFEKSGDERHELLPDYFINDENFKFLLKRL
jgi:hypothetical protein